MVDALLDTNVIVDLLRGYPLAQAWIATQQQPAICRLVYMEVLQGAENKQKMNQAVKFLGRFTIIEHTQDDFLWATQQLIQYHLSNNVDVTDALIAAPAHRLNLPFYTRNLKHFVPIIPNLVNQPY
jgi:predicted nucleic acid-binding protein